MKYKKGDIVYQIGKLESSKTCLSISIFKRIVGEPMTLKTGWWLLNDKGGMVGGATEDEMFRTREEALDYIKNNL